jgi:hypothetical protein
VIFARVTFSRALAAALAVAVAACGGASVHPWTPPSERDSHEDPARLRSGYGNATLHTWWPLTEPEIAALGGVAKARQGDPEELLALAILASGDHRDAASYAAYGQRVAAFVADVRPAVEGAADDWHKGYELHRAMHRVFFTAGQGELGGYDLSQSRVTGIFDAGRYNCISSAMLFAVLARQFGMQVRGVQEPTHVFIELGPRGGKTLEVETTSDTGFDLVHDERFFRENASKWSSARGLRPVTMADYQQRQLLEPYRLMASGMKNQAGLSKRDEDRSRLLEAASLVDPDDAEALRLRVESYAIEAQALYKQNASRTIVAMFDVVWPAVSDAATRGAKDGPTTRYTGWARWFYASALEAVGRGDDATTQANEALDQVASAGEDAAMLRENDVGVLDDQMMLLMKNKQYPEATKVMGKHLEACRAVSSCLGNLEVVYRNWSIESQNLGDWQAARQALQACVAQLPGDPACSADLRDLESRHRF